MNVNEIRDRIVELSHQTAGDGEVQAKALGWLNAAYHELMDEVVVYLPPELQVREDAVSDENGVVALANAPYRVSWRGQIPTEFDHAAAREARARD